MASLKPGRPPRRPLALVCALVLIVFTGGTGAAFAAPQVLASNDNVIEVVYRFNPPVVTESGDYDSIRIPGLNNTQVPGEPELPEQPVRVLLPQGRQAKDFKVIPGKKVQLSGTYQIEPAQEPLPLSLPHPIQKTLPNPAVYRKNAAYPGKISEAPAPQAKRAFEVLQTTLYPVEFNPASGKIYYYPEIRVRVELEPALARLSGQRRIASGDKAELKSMVDNPASADSYQETAAGQPRLLGESSLPEPLADFKYVIITSQALSTSDFTKLVLHKQSKGLTAKIVTTEWIYANYNGTRPDGKVDNQTRIRNFIIDAHNNWGTDYVPSASTAPSGTGSSPRTCASSAGPTLSRRSISTPVASTRSRCAGSITRPTSSATPSSSSRSKPKRAATAARSKSTTFPPARPMPWARPW
jgi:hypothetical protein